jgi:predicted PurR-regulated permease PerM
VVAIIAYGLLQAVTLVVPLVLAVILGILFAPLVDIMERRRIPRAAGAGVTMLLILAIAVGTVWLVESSVAGQLGTIQKQLNSAALELQTWFDSLALPAGFINEVTVNVKAQIPKLGQTAANALLAGISGIASFLFGTFLAFYMLFFTLKDNEPISTWIGSHVGLPADLGHDIVQDSFVAVRQYFKGTTVLAFTTTIATALGLWAIGMPLVGAISVVTFVLSYIPFFGAIVSGIFTVLIALGAGGVPLALQALVIVLVAQNILQSVIQAWAIGSALDLHPLVVLISTTLGGIFGGLIGGMLGAPIAAMAVRTVRRLQEANLDGDSPSVDTPPPAESAVAEGA